MPESPSTTSPALCRPNPDQACFACCPPIRPPGYDHLDYRSFLTREFVSQTPFSPGNMPTARPITGLSCWGLGFLRRPAAFPRDPVLVGCRLHPGVNGGYDCRDLTGYGDKCRRESCGPARVLSSLPVPLAHFVLGLTRGLDSFEYSSRRANPAFRLLEWGPRIISCLMVHEPNGLSRQVFRDRWRLLNQDLEPHTDAYPLELLLPRLDLAEMARSEFLLRYRQNMDSFINRHRRVMTLPMDRRPFIHHLGIPLNLVWFLRFALGWSRAAHDEAGIVSEALAETLAKL